MHACVCVHVRVCMTSWPVCASVFLCVLCAWLHEFTYVFLDLQGHALCLRVSVRVCVLCVGDSARVCLCVHGGDRATNTQIPSHSPGPLSGEEAAAPAAEG